MGFGLSKVDFEVIVKTGDVKGAGTDSNVYIALVDEEGHRSRDILLDVKWRNDFEKGNIDRFKVRNAPELVGGVETIELWRDESGLADDWFVEYIMVRRVDNDQTYPFPCHRWIGAKRRYILSLYDSCLPQQSKNKEQRKTELEEKRAKYDFTPAGSGTPRRVAKCPVEENFSNDYQWDIIGRKYKMLAQAKFKKLITSDSWCNLDEFKSLYTGSFKMPYGYNNWESDESFGLQRLIGVNPCLIKVCTKIPENFAVTNDMVKEFLIENSLNEALEKNKIFIVNLDILEGICCKDDRILCPAMALFYSKDGVLLPIAIQLFQQPSEQNPVFLPSDPQYTWMLAKMYFNNADSSLHQACTHLGFTHLVCESVCVCTHRHLSPSHPVFRLLAPHFLYLLAINTLAVEKLLAPGGWIDVTMTMGVKGLMEILTKSWSNWRLDTDAWLPNEIEKRGVGDKHILPKYYYRDDAMLIHDSVVKYVTEVLENVYDSPEKLKEDEEIQAWAKSLVDETKGAGIKGVFGNGSFSEFSDLVKTVASIIMLSSVNHASANFCQYDEYAFPPNYPAILLGSAPTTKDSLTIEDIYKQIPNKSTTLDIMVVTKLLSERGTNALGDFEIQYQYDPKALTAVENFRKELSEISAKIRARNATLQEPYPYLDPTEVPNAISI